MAKQPLRGSNEGKLKAIAKTLQVALDSAKSEKELRKMISGIIKTINPSTNG